MKKLIALCLVVVLTLSILIVPSYAADTETIIGYSWKKITFKDDVNTLPDLKTWTTGSTETAWKITDAAGMVKLSHIVNDGNNFSGKTVYLANDIDMKNVTTAPMLDADDASGAYDKYDTTKTDVFWPIGYNYGSSITDMTPTDANSLTLKIFSGTFDGQGHAILNFKIDTDIISNTRTDAGISEKCPVELGLFGAVRAATIQNLIMDSTCSIADRFRTTDDGLKTDGSAVGMFVGRSIGSTSTFKNLCNYGSIITSNGFVGGILGVVAPKTTIANCTNAGNITGVHVVGGLLGINNAKNEITFTNCRNTGKIIQKSNTSDGSLSTQYKARDGFSGAAGFVARTGGGNLKFTNCINSGNVEGYFKVGGFTGIPGSNLTFTFTNCMAYGTAKLTNNKGVVSNNVGPYTTARPTTFVLNGTSITTLNDFNAANKVTTEADTTIDYAKMERILQIKGQTKEGATNGTVNLRFVSTIDSTEYKQVGFKITVTPAGSTAKTYIAMSKNVYTAIQGSDKVSVVNYVPSAFSPDSLYFMTFTVTNIDTTLYNDMDITVQAIAELEDGTQILGKPMNCRIGNFMGV